MIVPDINLLLYAHDTGSAQHSAARRWWDGLLNGAESVGIPWLVAVGFVRLMSNPRAVVTSLPAPEAVDCVSDWFRHPHITPLNPGAGHLLPFRNILANSGGANLVPDAHLAALAIEYEAEIHTHNSDFDKFPNVHWRNPLNQP